LFFYYNYFYLLSEATRILVSFFFLFFVYFLVDYSLFLLLNELLPPLSLSSPSAEEGLLDETLAAG